jgi:hypothetical protein
MAMGNGERRQIATDDLSACDQVDSAPSGVLDQSWARTRRAISEHPSQPSLTSRSEEVRSLTDMIHPPRGSQTVRRQTLGTTTVALYEKVIERRPNLKAMPRFVRL